MCLLCRKIEESHDWLSSLADNAITAGLSEETLKGLYASLDNEKAKGIESVQTALAAYKEQHNAILEAITVFAGRIQQHCFDYLQREQLVSRGFLQYTLGRKSYFIPCFLKHYMACVYFIYCSLVSYLRLYYMRYLRLYYMRYQRLYYMRFGTCQLPAIICEKLAVYIIHCITLIAY